MQHSASQDFAQPAPEPVARHRGRLMTRDDESEWRVTRKTVTPSQIEVLRASTVGLMTRFPARGELCTARDPSTARVPLARYRLRCLDGERTVRRLRPFLRRRDSVARPQTVFIRARNPCLLMRRRFLGRYVGPINSSCKAGKVTRRATRRSRLTFPHTSRSFAPALVGQPTFSENRNGAVSQRSLEAPPR